MRTKHKIALAFGAVVVFLLAQRSFGCGIWPGTETVAPTGPTTSGQVKEPEAVTLARSLPKAPVALRWWQTAVEGDGLRYATWQDKQWVWNQKDGKIFSHVLYRKESPGEVSIVSSPKMEEKGSVVAVAQFSNKLVRIHEIDQNVSLQWANANTDGTISWYTLRTFPSHMADAPKQVAFLGGYPIFFGPKEMYTTDPQKPQTPTIFKLPFEMLANTSHMQCGPDYCIALYLGQYPVTFKATWKWEVLPNTVHWQTVPVRQNPLAGESEAQKQAANAAFSKLLTETPERVGERLHVVQQQAAFLLREKYLFWTCAQDREPFQYHDKASGTETLAWADKDLLLLSGSELKVQYKAGTLALPLPDALKHKHYTLRHVHYNNGLLFLEASVGTTSTHTLFAAEYKTWPGYALCQ